MYQEQWRWIGWPEKELNPENKTPIGRSPFHISLTVWKVITFSSQFLNQCFMLDDQYSPIWLCIRPEGQPKVLLAPRTCWYPVQWLFLSQVVMVLCVSPQLTSGASKMSPDLAEPCPLLYSKLSPEDMLPGPGRASYEPPAGVILSHLSSLSLLSPVSTAFVFCPGKWIPHVLRTPGRSPYRSRGFTLPFVHALFSSFKRVQAISPLSWTWPSQWWLLHGLCFRET